MPLMGGRPTPQTSVTDPALDPKFMESTVSLVPPSTCDAN